MDHSQPIILEVVLPTPVRQYFDYLLPNDWPAYREPQPGCRVKVQFGPSKRTAIVVEVKHSSALALNKIKPCIEILDDEPLLDNELLTLAKWASAYYHYSLGEICFKMLPTLLRSRSEYKIRKQKYWKLTAIAPSPDSMARAAKQQFCLQVLSETKNGCSIRQLKSSGVSSHILTALHKKQWIEKFYLPLQPEAVSFTDTFEPKLSEEQEIALQQCKADSFNVHLLDGITGSGKTEIYIQLIKQQLDQSKQVLVLVPEIGLTPQLFRRFQQRLQIPIGLLHSGLSDQERLENWIFTKQGKFPVLIGTRSALFTPMKNLGLIIIDEEHDASLKQQQGWQYSARDLALVRARNKNIPIVLGSATPSLESLYNAISGKYQHLKLRQRPGSGSVAAFNVLDIRKLPMEQGFSRPLLQQIGQHLSVGNQVMIFMNRRGYAPVLMCHDCGWKADCKRCESSYTLHQRPYHLHCHHCNGTRKIPQQCPDCQSLNITPIGIGTERIEALLADKFPNYPLIRIDRDSTRRKDAMKNYVRDISQGHYKILIGTQMLSKGHHFPDVSLVAILDMDGALFSADFRAAEKFGQQLTQVAGRAGRAEKQGKVLLQTHHPDHPQLLTLLTYGYTSFAKQMLDDRKQCLWPPFSYLAMFRAEASNKSAPEEFLQLVALIARNNMQSGSGISVLGPIPAPMPIRAGKFRYQLLLQAGSRQSLQRHLQNVVFKLESEKTAKSVRWSLDVDPLEMF